ncbi:hypothetical protein AHF37_06210 [Paragonimus kellicotti]|nr:hypothetical protein AHF37_06210 [Paragonimus kellicotti]
MDLLGKLKIHLGEFKAMISEDFQTEIDVSTGTEDLLPGVHYVPNARRTYHEAHFVALTNFKLNRLATVVYSPYDRPQSTIIDPFLIDDFMIFENAYWNVTVQVDRVGKCVTFFLLFFLHPVNIFTDTESSDHGSWMVKTVTEEELFRKLAFEKLYSLNYLTDVRISQRKQLSVHTRVTVLASTCSCLLPSIF